MDYLHSNHIVIVDCVVLYAACICIRWFSDWNNDEIDSLLESSSEKPFDLMSILYWI